MPSLCTDLPSTISSRLNPELWWQVDSGWLSLQVRYLCCRPHLLPRFRWLCCNWSRSAARRQNQATFSYICCSYISKTLNIPMLTGKLPQVGGCRGWLVKCRGVWRPAGGWVIATPEAERGNGVFWMGWECLCCWVVVGCNLIWGWWGCWILDVGTLSRWPVYPPPHHSVLCA